MPTSQEEVKPLGCDALVSSEPLLHPGWLSKSDTFEWNLMRMSSFREFLGQSTLFPHVSPVRVCRGGLGHLRPHKGNRRTMAKQSRPNTPAGYARLKWMLLLILGEHRGFCLLLSNTSNNSSQQKQSRGWRRSWNMHKSTAGLQCCFYSLNYDAAWWQGCNYGVMILRFEKRREWRLQTGAVLLWCLTVHVWAGAGGNARATPVRRKLREILVAREGNRDERKWISRGKKRVNSCEMNMVIKVVVFH